MKTLIIFSLYSVILTTSFASVGDEVFIRGKISNIFDNQKVKVIDSLGQTYMLPKKLFPKDFEFKQDKEFSLEVPSKELVGVKKIK